MGLGGFFWGFKKDHCGGVVQITEFDDP